MDHYKHEDNQYSIDILPHQNNSRESKKGDNELMGNTPMTLINESDRVVPF